MTGVLANYRESNVFYDIFTESRLLILWQKIEKSHCYSHLSLLSIG